MARTVEDAAILLGAMAGADPNDPATAGAPPNADYTRFLDPHGLSGARLGLVRSKAFGFGPDSEAVLDQAVAALRAAGAEVLEVELPHLGETDDSELDVLLYELETDLGHYLAGRPGAKVASVADLIAFDERERAREMPWFGQELFEMAAKKGGLDDQAYRDDLAKDGLIAKSIDEVMVRDHLQALVALTNGPAHVIDLVVGDHWSGSSSSPAAVAGYPSITVPAGFVHGLPVGLSFFARAWSEPRLVALAYAFEQQTKARRPPRFAPHAEVSFAPVPAP